MLAHFASRSKSFRSGGVIASLAFASLFGSPRRTEAATVTRAVNVTLNASNLDDYALDLNGDGTNDFTFQTAYVPDPTLTVGFDQIAIPFASGNGSVIDAATGDGFPASTRLALGASVGPTRTFSSVNDLSNLYSFDDIDGASGNFGGQTGFVGLRFDSSTGVRYGFAQITVKALSDATGPFKLTIGTVGYNTVVGQAVTIAVPEPTTIMLGALGLLVARRRRGHR